MNDQNLAKIAQKAQQIKGDSSKREERASLKSGEVVKNRQGDSIRLSEQ